MLLGKTYHYKFTLLELLIVIAIITILTAIMLPSLQKVREKGKAIVCVGNLKQIGHAFLNYADDNMGHAPNNNATANFQFGPYPWGSVVNRTLCPYLGDTGGAKLAPVSKCPSGRMDSTVGINNDIRLASDGTSELPNPSYKMNDYFVMRTWGDGTDSGAYCSLIAKIPYPTQRMIYSDWHYTNTSITWENIDRRHSKGANVLFLDNHVKYFNTNEVLNLGAGGDMKNQFWHNDRH